MRRLVKQLPQLMAITKYLLTSNRFFEKLFMAILFTLLRGNRRRNTFCFYFDVWPRSRTLALLLISQHTTHQTTAIEYLQNIILKKFCISFQHYLEQNLAVKIFEIWQHGMESTLAESVKPTEPFSVQIQPFLKYLLMRKKFLALNLKTLKKR